MIIDRQHIKEQFAEYVKNYDADNPKVALKIVHTYKVADICEQIGRDLHLSEEDVDLAWAIGMLHDIGRFEQLRRYNTFVDAVSVSHAALGVQILFEDGVIRNYISDNRYDQVIYAAINNHSLYRIEEGLDERTTMFCHIIRDADKIDIIRVQLDTPLEEIYDVSTYELKHSVVSKEVMQSFDECHAVERSLKKTAVDYVVGHISLSWELVYKISRTIMWQQGHLIILMDFESENPETVKQFEHIKSKVRAAFGNEDM